MYLDMLSDQGWSSMHHPLALASDGGAFTGDELVDELEKHPNFELLTQNAATRILCSSKGRATGVELYDTARGESVTIGAEVVVVCGGGIETPNLLQRSTNEWWPEGLGNHSGHLGRHLVSHIGIAIGGRPRGLRLIDGPIGPTATTRYFDTERYQASGKSILLWRPAPSGFLFLNSNVEQFPSDTNTVRMSSTKTRFGMPAPVIDFNYDEGDEKRANDSQTQLEGLAEGMGLKISNRRRFTLAHPMCAARMSEDPGDGVVDAQLRIHSMNNVYVCSCASFTSGGAANPTVTIAALAHRLGDHLANGKSADHQS